MSAKAREGYGDYYGDSFEAMHLQGAVVQKLTGVGASSNSCDIEIGTAPDAENNDATPIASHGAEYFAVKPGTKLSAYAGGTEATSAAFGLKCTLIRVYYDPDNGSGTVTITEAPERPA